MAAAAQGLTGADIAYLCQRAAIFCVKQAARGSNDASDIAIGRHHFDAALCLLTTAHATDATSESPRCGAASRSLSVSEPGVLETYPRKP